MNGNVKDNGRKEGGKDGRKEGRKEASKQASKKGREAKEKGGGNTGKKKVIRGEGRREERTKQVSFFLGASKQAWLKLERKRNFFDRFRYRLKPRTYLQSVGCAFLMSYSCGHPFMELSSA